MSHLSGQNLSRRNFLAAGVAAGTGLAAIADAQTSGTPRSIDDFFRDFTADWVRRSPSLATASRYFTGDEQDGLERRLTPDTREWQLDRIRRSRAALAELSKFKRAALTDSQRVSAVPAVAIKPTR